MFHASEAARAGAGPQDRLLIIQSRKTESFGGLFLNQVVDWAERPDQSWGAHQLLLDFAGGPYLVSGLSSEQMEAIRERFEGLCRAGDHSAAAAGFRVCRAPEDWFRPVITRNWDYTFDRDYHAEGVLLAGMDFVGRIELAGSLGGRVLTCREKPDEFLGLFENFFRALVAYRLLQSGGVLFHSAAIADGERAYLFAGRSGAGKSTISRLALEAGWEVLSDDMNALTRSADGWQVEKLPFAGDLGQTATRSGVYPVAGVYWLEKAGAHGLRPMGDALALARLTACAPVVNQDPFRGDRLWRNLGDLIAAVGVEELHFARDTGVFDLLCERGEAIDAC